MVRLAGYRQLISSLVIFDRSLRVRCENSVDLTGIDSESTKRCLGRPDLVVAELEIVPAWRLWHLDETILIQKVLASCQPVRILRRRDVPQVCVVSSPCVIPLPSLVRRRVPGDSLTLPTVRRGSRPRNNRLRKRYLRQSSEGQPTGSFISISVARPLEIVAAIADAKECSQLICSALNVALSIRPVTGILATDWNQRTALSVSELIKPST